jgi:hypothetical protein
MKPSFNTTRLYPAKGTEFTGKSGWNVLNSLNQPMSGGGAGCSTSNNGIPYPNGLAGGNYSFNGNHLPGSMVQGDNNHYALLKTPTLQTQDYKARIGGGGFRRKRSIRSKRTKQSKRTKRTKRNTMLYRQLGCCGANYPNAACSCPCCSSSSSSSRSNNKTKQKKRKSYRGGSFNNSVLSSVVNLGRQVSYGLHNTSNALKGIPPMANPIPWEGQLQQKPSLAV